MRMCQHVGMSAHKTRVEGGALLRCILEGAGCSHTHTRTHHTRTPARTTARTCTHAHTRTLAQRSAPGEYLERVGLEPQSQQFVLLHSTAMPVVRGRWMVAHVYRDLSKVQLLR